MTTASGHNLNRAKLRRLLAAVGSAHTPDDTAPEVVQYDWRDPHYFNEEQRNRLAAVMSQVAALITERFTHFHNGESTVAPTAIAQHFAAHLNELPQADRNYYLAFGADEHTPYGFLCLDSATAVKWVTQLLGDSEPEQDPQRSLSPLEESLLYDLSHGVIEAFLSPLQSQQPLHCGDRITQGTPDVSFEPTEEICTIRFLVSGDDTESTDEMLFVVPCRQLAPLVGKALPRACHISPDELARVLAEHVREMPVTVAIRLASTALNVETVSYTHLRAHET